MNVQLKFFAGLRNLLPGGEGPHYVELPEGATVGDALDSLKVPPEAPHILLVNAVHAERDQVLNDGDLLSAFPPVAGG